MKLIQSLHRIRQQDIFGNVFPDQSYHVKLATRIYAKHGLELVLTCPSHPEQYDVFKGEDYVAYYRLRHGEFRVDFSQCGEETIYESQPSGDGYFTNDERLHYLLKSMRILIAKLKTYQI